MATAITKSNLFSEPRNNIVDIISANLTDPVSSSSQFRKWIYSREPDIKSAGFKGFPIVIINASELDKLKAQRTVDRKSNKVDWTIEMEVISSDRGNGKQAGRGLEYLDSVSDQLVQVLGDTTNLDTLRENLIHNLTFSASGVDTESLADELVFRRTFILNFDTKIQTS